METKDIIIAILVAVVIFVLGYIFVGPGSEMVIDDSNGNDVIEEVNGDPEEEDEEEDEEVDPVLREIVSDYIGSPHDSDPLDDDENVYNNEAFNSTTLVLISAADYHFPDDPEKGMEEIHYYPPGEVSYETRLHFSTYRNRISEYFTDITLEVAEDLAQSKMITLNKDGEDGRLLDIDWEEEIELHYVDLNDLTEVIPELPEVAGITFIVDGDEDIGLDVRGEGLLIDGDRLIRSSSSEGEVIEESILDFLEDQDYDAVNFFKINE